MCTLFFAYKQHKDYPFVYFGNRDEFLSRSTQRALFNNNILMGRDLEKGGTWFGLTRSGRIGFLTNYRDMGNIRENASTRGHLITDYLKNDISPVDYLERLKRTKFNMNDYNLIIGNMNELYYYTSIKKTYKKLLPGIYGLSNAFLNTPWYKVNLGLKAYSDLTSLSSDRLFEILNDTSVADDHELPSTKLSDEAEKALSALHVDFGNYGTVYKQVVLFDGQTISYYDRIIKDQFKNTQSIRFQME